MYKIFIINYDDDYGLDEEYELCTCKGEEQAKIIGEYLHADQNIFAWRKEKNNV